MKAFGISALVISIISIFVPVVGAFMTGLSGFLAFFSAGKGTTLGLSAVIINVVNIILLSPTLILAAEHQSSATNKTDLKAAFGILITIQFIAICIFVIKWFVSRKKVVDA